MELKNFLLVLIILLLSLTGLGIFIGSGEKRREKLQFFFFFILFGIVWTISTIIFLNSPENSNLTKTLSSILFFIPIAMGLLLILCYYAILRHNFILLSKKSLKFISYVVIVTTAAAAYMLIFSAIVTFLFKIERLSSEIYILNFLMITILLFILPITHEISQSVHSFIIKDEEYLVHLFGRMSKMYAHADADKLAKFVARNLHLTYVGIVIDKKVHGSKNLDFSSAEIKLIKNLRDPEHDVWQELDSGTKIMLENHKIAAVAAMRESKGKTFGQMLIGLPRGKNELEKADREQIAQIVNFIAAMIDSRSK
ncbi:hypothetical protein IJ768_00500 [Candidatus Saccharibacteria bacterium]|nr:hypothetical protein [Candidatus Saccharibacteria bacterium]